MNPDRIENNNGYIDYEFIYADVNGNNVAGRIVANYLWDTFRWVQAVPSYTIEANGSGVTTWLTGNVQNAILDSLTPAVARDADLNQVIITVTYTFQNEDRIKTTQTGINGQAPGDFQIRVFQNVPITVSAKLEGFEEEIIANYVPDGNPLNFDMWPHPTNVSGSMRMVQGEVRAYEAPELAINNSLFQYFPLPGATVTAIDGSGFVLPGVHGSISNSAGIYMLVGVPLGMNTFQANHGSKAATEDHQVTANGPNNDFHIQFNNHRPYCSMTAIPNIVNPGETTTIEVTGTDVENEVLYYDYSVSPVQGEYGTINELPGYEENSNTWTAPSSLGGNFVISSTVSDGSLTFTCSTSVVVNSAGPVLLVSDNFNRQDGVPAIMSDGLHRWFEPYNPDSAGFDLQIQANTLGVINAGQTGYAYAYAADLNDTPISVSAGAIQWTYVSGTLGGDLYYKSTAAAVIGGDRYVLSLNVPGINWYKKEGTQLTSLYYSSDPMVPGDVYRIDFDGSGTHTLRRNGTVIATSNEASGPSGGYVGVLMGGTVNGTLALDDFELWSY